MKNILIAATALAALATLNAPAQAQYCEGKVRGLSAHYNPDTGAGFLAVRTKPKKYSRQIGELFNGEKVEIFDRKGNWYRVAALHDASLDGWAHARWIRNDCGY